jgi:hypothetical protein
MRLWTMVRLIFVASFLLFARTSAAQTETGGAPPPPPQSSQNQQAPNPAARRGWPIRPGPMAPDVMVSMGPVWRSQGMETRTEGPGGPLRVFSRLLDALDNPRIRSVLGLTDQQADGLRKIIVTTEVFTIQTGAGIAVDGIDLRELLRADNLNKAAVMAKGDDISKAVSQLINHYLDAILSAKTILTPKQQEMIREYFENGAGGMRTARPQP